MSNAGHLFKAKKLVTMHWTNGFGGGWMMIFWVILTIAIVLGLFQMFRTTAQSNNAKQESALELLKRRYANGEISKEEFEEKKKDL